METEERGVKIDCQAEKKEPKVPPINNHQLNNILSRHNMLLITKEQIDKGNKLVEELTEYGEDGEVKRYPTGLNVKLPKALGYKMSMYSPLKKFFALHSRKYKKNANHYGYLYLWKITTHSGTIFPLTQERYTEMQLLARDSGRLDEHNIQK